jgi:hypothetical protein
LILIKRIIVQIEKYYLKLKILESNENKAEPILNTVTEDFAKMNIHNEKAKKKEMIQNQNENVSEELLCTICLAEKKNILFQPCNHLSCCEICAIDLTTKHGNCPICRIKITNSIKIYIV